MSEPIERDKEAEFNRDTEIDVINIFDIFVMRNIIMKTIKDGFLQGEEKLYADLMRKKLERQLEGKEHLFKGG